MRNKIFIKIASLFAASACLFSLAACASDKATPTDTALDGWVKISQSNYRSLLELKGDEKVCLTEDIDMSGAVWRSEVNFNGVFDGRGYTIKNLEVEGKILAKDESRQGGGLFYSLGGNATVRNVAFVNAKVGDVGQDTAVIAYKAIMPQHIGEYNKIENVFIQVKLGGEAWAAGVVERGNYVEMTDVVVVAETAATEYKNRQGIVAGLSTNGVKMNNCYFISNTFIGRIQNDHPDYENARYDESSTFILFNPDEDGNRTAEQMFYREKRKTNSAVSLTEQLETWVARYVSEFGF